MPRSSPTAPMSSLSIQKGKVWLALPDKNFLVSPYQVYPESTLLQPAQAFTVSMLSCVINKDLDSILRRDRNDLLIMTRTALGSRPLVERVHFYEKDIPLGEPILNLLSENVFLSDDYSGNERLWLEIDILEIATNDGDRRAVVNVFQELVGAVGAAFPAIALYTYPINAIARTVERIISAAERDTYALKVPFSLYPGKPTRGRAPLQTGVYVVFAQDQYGQSFRMDDKGELWTTEGRPAPVSYATFDIVPMKRVSPDLMVSQKLATLLTQMRSKEESVAKATLGFLKDTVTDYNHFRLLERYYELAAKSDRSREETARMQAIATLDVLKPYLSKPPLV